MIRMLNRTTPHTLSPFRCCGSESGAGVPTSRPLPAASDSFWVSSACSARVAQGQSWEM